MTTITRPMLAAAVSYEELHELEWPVLCSPKVDGIRCLIHPTLGPVTRSFKPLPNEFVRDLLERHVGHSYLDGELVATNLSGDALSFNQTQSAMMSHSGQPYWKYLVFDCFEQPEWDFATRYKHAEHLIRRMWHPNVEILVHTMVDNVEDFCKFTDRCIEDGYEGSIIRAPAGIYKNGRSTRRQGWLLKFKEWADAEGTIIGFVELMHNSNEDIRDNFDLAKRSSAKDGMVPMGTLGALEISTEWGTLFLGSGLDQALRQVIWDRNMVVHTTAHEWIVRGKQPDMGRTVTFKYQVHGMQELPRFPIFKGFRGEE